MAMPFVLCSFPVLFEQLMETILWGLMYELYCMYQDDVIMIGHVFKEHMFNSQKVYQHFHEAHLKHNLENVNSFKTDAVPGSYCVTR